jgi:hypothetical protein
MPFKLLEKTFYGASALVRLIDGFTGEAVALPVKIRVTSAAGNAGAAAEEVEFVPARPGEYGFVDLASGEYEISWESKYFFPPRDPKALETFTYNVSVGYTQPKVVTLRPTPAYPFPPGTTLLRGGVVDADDKPVKGAAVYAVYREDNQDKKWEEGESETTTDGEFVLFFKRIKMLKENGQVGFRKGDDGTYYVVAKGGSESDIELTVRAELDAVRSADVKVQVAAEKANTLGLDGEGKPEKVKLPS